MFFNNDKDPFNGAGDPPPERGSKEWHEWFRKVLGDNSTTKEFRRALFNYMMWHVMGFGVAYFFDCFWGRRENESRKQSLQQFNNFMKNFVRIGRVYPRSGEPVLVGLIVNPYLTSLEELTDLALFAQMVEIHNIDFETMSDEQIMEALNKNEAYRAWASKKDINQFLYDLENLDTTPDSEVAKRIQKDLENFSKKTPKL